MPLNTRAIGGMVDVVAVGLVVTAGYQHKSMAEIETTSHVPNAKVPSSKQG
jgi:hypothetical protein